MSNVIALRRPRKPETEDPALIAVCYRIISRIGGKHFVTPEEILGDGRDKFIVKARDEAILCVKRQTGFTSKRIAEIFNKERSSIRHSIRRTRARVLAKEIRLG